MKKVISFLWGVILAVAFQGARIVFTITKTRVKGALVAIWYEGKILLIKKSYRRKWSVPGGMVNKGETRKQAAVRETFEEVQVDTLYQLLVEKGYFTEAEFLSKMKEVQVDYQNSRRH